MQQKIISIHTWNMGVIPEPPASMPNALTWPGWYLKRPWQQYHFANHFPDLEKIQPKAFCSLTPQGKHTLGPFTAR